MTPMQDRMYAFVTASTAPVWLAMLLAPRSAATSAVVAAAPVLQVGLGAGYVGLLASSVLSSDGPRVSFADGDSVRRGLAAPRGFLTAWTHMVTLDLAVGIAIWRRSLAEGRSSRAALLATWFAGPSGFVVDEVARALARRRAG